MQPKMILAFLAGTVVTMSVLALPVLMDVKAAEPRAKSSPTQALPELDVYYPGTEDIAPDEMRVVALGTGMPSPRPKQVAACWLVELGNGDKFLFDIV